MECAERWGLPLGFLEMRKAVHCMLLAEGEAFEMANQPLQIEEAWQFADDYLELRSEFPTYHDIGRTYAESMKRIRALSLLPIDLFITVHLSTVAACSARHQSGIDPMDFRHDGKIPGFRELCEKVYNKIKPPDVGAEQQRHISAVNIERITTPDDPLSQTLRMAIESILAAMTTAAYAAFETMAFDLWEAALNRYDKLAEQYMSSANRNKSMTLGELAGIGLRNVSTSMGTALILNNKVPQASFKDLINAYYSAFGDGIQPVFSDMESMLETQYVRHLIAHRGGMIDTKFHSDMKRYPEYADLPIGTQIPFKGALTCRHVNACVKMGVALFSAVDSWSV